MSDERHSLLKTGDSVLYKLRDVEEVQPAAAVEGMVPGHIWATPHTPLTDSDLLIHKSAPPLCQTPEMWEDLQEKSELQSIHVPGMVDLRGKEFEVCLFLIWP